MFARQLCRRIPEVAGFRPVVLRPTLSGGLPLSGFEAFVPTLDYCKGAAARNVTQVIENNER